MSQLSLFNLAALSGASGPADVATMMERMRSCTACTLCTTRRTVVTGTGQLHKPTIAFVVDPPDIESNVSGEVIHGEFGELIGKIIAWMGLKPAECFFIPALGCMPPSRPATQKETEACRPYIQSALAGVQPEWIVTFGLQALRTVLGLHKKTDKQLVAGYGAALTFESIPLMPTHSGVDLTGKKRQEYLTQTHEHLRRVVRRLKPKELPL